MSQERPNLSIYKTTKGNLGKDEIDGLVSAAVSGFNGNVTENDVIDHLDGDLYIAKKGAEVVGFGSSKINGSEAYLAGAVVKVTAQGDGLYSKLLNARLSDAIRKKLTSVSTRTQNYKVDAALTSALNRYVDLGILKGYSITRIKLPSAYGKRLSPQEPPANSPYKLLDLASGDAYLLRATLNH